MTVGVREFLNAALARHREVDGDLRDVDALLAKHEETSRALDQQHAETLRMLAAAVLPALTPEAIARAVRLTSFAALTQDDPRARIEAERQRLAARIAEIEREPRYADRVRLRAPRTGDLVRQEAELEDFRAPFVELMTRCHEHARFAHLMDVGYGTDAYKVAWWRVSYYRDWKAGDEIVAKLADKKTFAEVRADYDNARQTVGVYDNKLGELRAEIGAGEALEREHDQAADRAAHLEELHLAEWRDRLAKHLANLEPADVADRMSGEPDVELLLKQAAGLKKKLEYLGEVVTRQVTTQRRALGEEKVALERDIAKYQRPKKLGTRFEEDQLRRRFQERPAKMRKSWQRTHDTYYAVSGFDDWQRARLVNDFLWWDLMTHGRWDGGYIPEVQAFRDRHPDYRWDRDAAAEQAALDQAVAAHVEAEAERQGDASVHHDAS